MSLKGIIFHCLGLLRMDHQTQSSEPVTCERKGGDWYYHDEQCEFKPSSHQKFFCNIRCDFLLLMDVKVWIRCECLSTG